MVPLEKQAAQLLTGKTLPDGWRVIEKLSKDPDSTGGVYSSCYEVEKEGRRGFLKAFDYTGAERVGREDPAAALRDILNAFTTERDILQACKQRVCRNVVEILGTGNYDIEEGVKNPTVHYLILEYADGGDLRKALNVSAGTGRRPFVKWQLRSLHQLSNGLRQIHDLDIAHQDVKPSNVVACDGGRTKLTDFGSAIAANSDERTLPSRLLQKAIAGSWAYAPPELLYGQVSPDFVTRRIGCDLYLLGSMVAYYFTNMSMTSLIRSNIQESISWTNPETWGNYSQVKAYLTDAFEIALGDIADKIEEREIRDQLVLVIRYLCNPDPSKRGHKRTIDQRGPNYNLGRFVTIFDRLASFYH